MNISERYRNLVADVRYLRDQLETGLPEGGERPCRMVSKALGVLSEMQESVGEIPRMHLEGKISPVLLKAHTDLDRARLEVEKLDEKQAARIWDLEQTIYRLLNSL